MFTQSMIDRADRRAHRRMWGVIACVVALLAIMHFAGCSPTPPKTDIHGGQVVQGNSFNSTDTGASHKKHTAFTITPAVLPTLSQPHITSPTTQPSTFNIDGQTLAVPPGASITYTTDVEDHDIPATVAEENHATALGTSISTDGDKGSITGEPPTVQISGVSVKGLNGSGAKGGGGKSSAGADEFSWTAIVAEVSAASSTSHWMMGFGALVLIGGWLICGVYSWFTDKIQWTTIAIVTGVGVAIIGTAVILDSHPIIFILAIVGGIGALVWHFYHKVNAATADTAAPTIPTTPTTPTTTASNLITTAEADAKAAVAKVEGLIAGMFGAKPTTPTAAEIAVAKVSQTVNGS